MKNIRRFFTLRSWRRKRITKCMILASHILRALWLYIGGVIAVFAMYYLLTGVEQGIDVVIHAGETPESWLLSLMAVGFWAFLVWYSCRLLSYARQSKNDEKFWSEERAGKAKLIKFGLPTRFLMHPPRILAFNCFVCVQVAILQLPTFCALKGWQMLAIIVFHNTLYFVFTIWLSGSLDPTKKDGHTATYKWISIVAIAAYSIFLLVLFQQRWGALSDHAGRHKFWLSIMALVMFAMELVSARWFVRRRRRVDINIEKRKENIRQHKEVNEKPNRVLNYIGLLDTYNFAEKKMFRILWWAAGAAALFYVGAWYSMSWSRLMGPMAFAVLALGVLVGLSNMVTALSIKKGVNLFIAIYLWAILLGIYWDPYKVRLSETPPETVNIYNQRPTINKFLARWFTHHVTLLDKNNPQEKFHTYIILSNGGASRAGHWTTSVLSRLQDSSDYGNPNESFKDHILCIGGASGGTIGNAAFYSLLMAEKNKQIKSNEFSPHCQSFFESDFLTYTLARMLGPDIFHHVVPLYISGDRTAALEDVMSDGSRDEVIGEYFDKSFTQFMDTTGQLPLLFFNSTRVDNGMPGVVSTVKLRDTTKRADILALVDSLGRTKHLGDIKVKTAAVLSSRFPYVSPAGRVFDSYYVDGGYFDNSGAGTVLEFVQELKKFLNNPGNDTIQKYKGRFVYHIIHLTNSEKFNQRKQRIHPLTNDLLAPILTLAGMQGANTNISDEVLNNQFKELNRTSNNNLLIEFSLYKVMQEEDSVTKQRKYEEGYPMSWIISNYQLQRMSVGLDSAFNRLKKEEREILKVK